MYPAPEWQGRGWPTGIHPTRGSVARPPLRKRRRPRLEPSWRLSLVAGLGLSLCDHFGACADGGNLEFGPSPAASRRPLPVRERHIEIGAGWLRKGQVGSGCLALRKIRVLRFARDDTKIRHTKKCVVAVGCLGRSTLTYRPQ